jgi:glucosamine 6-phosphate synthetase-like amidotransferase/phosphosugar isomerase protein
MMIRDFAKRAYYFTLSPLYRLVKAEAADEARAITQAQVEELTQELKRVTKEMKRVTNELEHMKRVNLEQQERIVRQVTDEFIKMYEQIELIKADSTDVKLNVTLVNELVKIHQSLESLKYERNGKG